VASKEFSREEVLDILRNNGRLAYFYIDGSVEVYTTDRQPLEPGHCSTIILMELRNERVIYAVQKDEVGMSLYPRYKKYDTYALAPGY
jgi:hypothetical protein